MVNVMTATIGQKTARDRAVEWSQRMVGRPVPAYRAMGRTCDACGRGPSNGWAFGSFDPSRIREMHVGADGRMRCSACGEPERGPSLPEYAQTKRTKYKGRRRAGLPAGYMTGLSQHQGHRAGR